MSVWTDERITELKARWMAGESASEIARAMSGALSRNAVIGKVHRLGLMDRDRLPPEGRDRPPRAPKVERQRYTRPPKPGPQNKPAVVFGAAPSLRKTCKPYTPAPEPLTPTKTLMELGAGDCRWIIGERVGRVFCGRQSTDCSPYCATHQGMAYQPGSASTGKDMERLLRRYV